MGLKDFFKKMMEPGEGTHPDVKSPSEDYPSPIDAISAILAGCDLDNGWVSFVVKFGGAKHIVEVAGTTINSCAVEIDLPSLLREAGLNALAETAHAGGKKQDDLTLHELPGASAQELAEVVHVVFRYYHKLPDNYDVHGSYNQ